MKKLITIIIVAVLVVSLVACSAAPAASSAAASSAAPAASSAAPASSAAAAASSAAPASSAAAAGDTYEIAMLTDSGSVTDKSFNQFTWEGVKAYADKNSKTYKYYKPAEATTKGYEDSIDLAVKAGAKIIVLSGFFFDQACFDSQTKYPDVKFLAIDYRPNNEDQKNPVSKTGPNTYSVLYQEQQPGFLAGYAAVKDGYTKLGFMGGMAVPAVERYGYGFVQGAEYAAKEMGLKDGSIELKYTYVGNFDATPDNQTLAASWYKSGSQIIFACGGSVGLSVMAAAEAANGKVIGVDVDQSGDSPSVVTSAEKYLGATVQDALTKYYAGQYPGGVEATLGAKENMVGLPDDFSKFKTFTKDDYTKLYTALAADTNGIASGIKKDTDVKAATDLGTKAVKVTIIGK